MDQRLKRLRLHEILLTITPNVYFQRATNLQLKYPCIVYARDRAATRHANNNPYSFVQGYQVTVIDQDPDSPLPGKVAELPQSSFSRHFLSGSLNHDIFTLYY